jgi:serine/threonine protein kinase
LESSFDKIQRNNCTLFVNKPFRNSKLEQALFGGEKRSQEDYDLIDVFSADTSHVYKFTVNFDGIERCVYFKQYLFRSVCDFIKHLFRASRAKRAFKATLMLEKNGFEAPTIVAMGELKSGFFARENFLVTFEVENAKQIRQFVPKTLENLDKEQLQSKRELIRAFGRTVGRMHAKGIFHGDLKSGNVLARREKNGWRFFFVDNERTKKFPLLPSWLRLKNLVQLNMHRDGISRTDRLRFFKSYQQENAAIRKSYKQLARKAIAKTRERLKNYS